jgi:hypothetical protein
MFMNILMNINEHRTLIFSKRNAECVVTTASGAKLIAGVPASSRVAGPIDDPSGPNTLKRTLQFKLLEVNTFDIVVTCAHFDGQEKRINPR